MTCYKLAEAALIESNTLILKRPPLRCCTPTQSATLLDLPPKFPINTSNPPPSQENQSRGSRLRGRLISSHIAKRRPSHLSGDSMKLNSIAPLCYFVNPARHQAWMHRPKHSVTSNHSSAFSDVDSQNLNRFELPYIVTAVRCPQHESSSPSSLLKSQPCSRPPIHVDKQNTFLDYQGSTNTMLLRDYSLQLYKHCSSDVPNVSGSTVQLSKKGDQGVPPMKGQGFAGKATPAQLSFVLLKLREEFPAFFTGHHSYNMYAENMKFENNLSSFAWTSESRKSYQLFLLTSRLAIQWAYHSTELDLMKITKNVEVGKIEARWRIRGKPRHLVRPRQRIILEGFSTFHVNKDGLISLHKMDRVMPAPRERSRVTSWLAQLTAMFRWNPKPVLPQPTAAQAILGTQSSIKSCLLSS